MRNQRRHAVKLRGFITPVEWNAFYEATTFGFVTLSGSDYVVESDPKKGEASSLLKNQLIEVRGIIKSHNDGTKSLQIRDCKKL